jgi:GAF domain-containing protein
MDEECIAYLERRNTELALIAEMTQMVSATLDPAEIEGMVLDTALQLTGARQCVLWVPLEGAAGWRRLVGTGVGEYRTESGDPQSDLLVWHILQEGRAVAGRDLPEVAERPELVSSLGLPLGNKGEFLALLTVAGLPFPEHSDDYLETLSLMAAPAALALRNARRYTELQRRERELDVRQRIMQTILRTLDLDERLTIALEETIRLLEAEIGGIYLAEGQRLLLRVHRGFSDEYLAYVGDLALADTSWASQATLHREHLREKTPPSAEVRRTFTEADKRAGVQAWVSVPLQVEEHLIGALVLASHRYDAFTADQVRALSALADQVAMAVQDAHLYTQARQRLARLTTLREIDRAIISHLELEEIIGVVLERVRPHLGVDAVGLSLIDWEKKCTTLAHFRFPDGTKIGADAFSLSDNLLEWLGRRQEPVLIYDLARDPRVANERGSSAATAWSPTWASLWWCRRRPSACSTS